MTSDEPPAPGGPEGAVPTPPPGEPEGAAPPPSEEPAGGEPPPVPAGPGEVPPNCPVCGAPLEPDQTYCLECGTPTPLAPPLRKGLGPAPIIALGLAVLGAGAGILAGKAVEQKVRATKQWEITVALDKGGTQTVTSESEPGWHAGDRVRLIDGKLQPV